MAAGEDEVGGATALRCKLDTQMNQQFPFTTARVGRVNDPVDKFGRRMDEGCLKAFAVLGPLRCLHSGFQPSNKESRGTFQQVFSCLAGLRSRFFEAGVIPDYDGASAMSDSGVIPDYDADSAVMYRLDAEPDYVLRTIPKEKLEQFRRSHKNIDWNNPDKEALAAKVFKYIPASSLRIDAVFDLKTDCVTLWDTKTRPQLISYGNQLALQNLHNGFPPRPIHMFAIDATRWRRCVFDPMTTVEVRDRKVTAFDEEQQKLRADWLKKKDPNEGSYFFRVEPWKLDTLQIALTRVNRDLMRVKKSVEPGQYLVSNLWDFARAENWNGTGLEGQLEAGTLSLCEALLRLTCGDKVCSENWTPQKFRMLFASQHEDEINRCLKFERDSLSVSLQPPRSLECTYSLNVIRAAMETIAGKPSFYPQEVLSKARGVLKEITRKVTASQDILQVGLAYGSPEFSDFAKLLKDIDIRKCQLVVDGRVSERDLVIELRALGISLENPQDSSSNVQSFPYHQVPEFDSLMNCKVLVCDASEVQLSFWNKLLGETGRLVVFARGLDETTLGMIKIRAEVFVVPVQCEASLRALASYLSIEVVNGSTVDLDKAIGDAEKIFMCGDKLMVYHQDGRSVAELEPVVELQVSGASQEQFMHRIQYVQRAVAAMNSARVKGVIPGDGIGFYQIGEKVDYAPLKAGVLHSSHFGGFLIARNILGLGHFQFAEGSEGLDMLDEGVIDLCEAAEQTLDQLNHVYKLSGLDQLDLQIGRMQKTYRG